MFYLVVDFTESKEGDLRPIVIGGRSFTTELHAQRYIDDSNLSRKAEIFEVTSSNLDRATQEVKAKLIRRYQSLDKGMKRAVHKL